MYDDLYLKIREVYPNLTWDRAIVQATLSGIITQETAYKLLDYYGELIKDA